MAKTRVLVLASSSLFAASMARDLHFDDSMEIAASVFTEHDAIQAVAGGGVDAIVYDMRIPGLNPMAFSHKVQGYSPSIPLLFLSRPGDVSAVAYRRFATEIVALPLQDTPLMQLNFARDLAGRIRRVVGGASSAVAPRGRWQPGMPFSTRFQGIIALGASAGGTEATEILLRKLPAGLPGMVITQHMPPNFTRVYAERLDRVAQLRVREAEDGDEIRPGVVLIAPGGMQTRVAKSAGSVFPVVRCGGEERVSGHCPSVDALFESVALACGSAAVGVILTGMGSDGGEGLLAMRRKGCFTIGQDEATSMVYGMPRVAFQKGAVVQQAPLDSIPHVLCSYFMGK